MPPELRFDGCDVRRLDQRWEVCVVEPDAEPADWFAARVPGTAALALRDAGRWRHGDSIDLDAYDCWFRTSFDAPAAEAGEEVVLRLAGVATVADVFLAGEAILESRSMFLEHELDVGALLCGTNELAIRCRALAPLLRVRRRPRARWRTRLGEGNLRFFRTMLLGRAPGFAPGPAPVGPWRPVTLERRRKLVVEEVALRPRLEGVDGVLAVQVRLRPLGSPLPDAVEVEVDGVTTPFRVVDGAARGEVRIANVARWWPHTHGQPALHDVRLRIGDAVTETRRVGFRTLEPGPGYDVEQAPLSLRVNGAEVFARGAVWTPIDFVGLAPSREQVLTALLQVRDAGMNILRVPGTGAYESADFHDLCDELGILVWQDFMFANFDYPLQDGDFRSLVEREARQTLAALAGRPSLAIICGNSEVEQQAAMLGLDPSLGRGELFGELLPGWVREAGADAVYVPSAPSGGELPFRADRGVANYYGVGGYRRGLDDARRADVGFAAESLAIANVPDHDSLEATGLGGVAVHDPRWKAGVPRDAGVGWDFDDVRDWYLERLFGVDPGELRRIDLDRYLELSRATSGELMAEVLGEWRRSGSSCAGALVLWLRDLAPGAGWGLIDVVGVPKVAYHHLRRVLAPVALWTTDEGLGGVAVHVANDRPETLRGTVRVALYRDLEHCVGEAATEVELAPRASGSWNVEGILGRFVDAAWAYRFGPPGHDLVVASLEDEQDGRRRLLSQAFRFPAGRPTRTESATQLGLEATASAGPGGSVLLRLSSRRLAYGVRVVASGWQAADDAFSVEPGHDRTLVLRGRGEKVLDGFVTALNLEGRVRVIEEKPR